MRTKKFSWILFGVWILYFVPNALFAEVLPKAIDSKEIIFVDGFYFYGGESAEGNCHIDTPQISEKELRKAGIPKDAPLLYMGEEVCDELKQGYFLANDTIADKYNDRDKRAILPNQVFNIIDTKLDTPECRESPCLMGLVVGRVKLADRNEFAAIELLTNDAKSSEKSGDTQNTPKSSQKANNGATSHTLGIIYKIFGYAGWREAQSNDEVRIVPLPLSAFESYEESNDSESPKEVQKSGYGGFLAKEYMLANTRPPINQYSGTPNFNPLLLPSAYLGLRFAKNITVFATPEAALKSTQNPSAGQNSAKSSAGNAGQNATKPNPNDIILDSIYYTAKRATLGREALAKRGVHLSAPLLDKVFILGLGNGKFEKIAQVLVIRGNSVYFWGYIALQDSIMRKEILEFYADMRGLDMQEAKKAYSFIPRERMPRQISLEELREIAKVEYPARVKVVADFESQSVEYRRKPHIDERAADSLPPSEKPSRDLSGYATYYQLPISGALNRQLDKGIIKKALNKAKKRGERELEIELVAEIKKGLLPQNMLLNAGDSEVADKKSPVMFRLANEKEKSDKASSPSVENDKNLDSRKDTLDCHTEGKARSISNNPQNRDISVSTKPQYDKAQCNGDLEQETSEDSDNKEALLCIGDELAKRESVPLYNEKWQTIGVLDKIAFKSKNWTIEKILGLNNTGRGDYYIINIRNAQGKVISHFSRVAKSVLMPCEKYDIASSPDYAKAADIRKRYAQISRSKMGEGEWILKLGETAIGNAKSVKSLKEAIKLAKSWDSDAKALKMLDLKRGDRRVEYDRGKESIPQKIAVDFVFVGGYEELDKVAKSSNDSNVFKQKILVILHRTAFILSDDEVMYINLWKMDF